MVKLDKLGDQLGALESSRGRRERAEARESMCDFLDQLIHDLNNPLSTYALEFHSIRVLIEALQAATDAKDFDKLRSETEVLVDILDNVERARERSQAIVGQLEHASKGMRG